MADEEQQGFWKRLRVGAAHVLAGDVLKAGGQKTPIDAGTIAAAIQGVRPSVRGTEPDTWMGPHQPLLPQAPSSVRGRAYDYPVGSNLSYTPRSGESVTYFQMRALAEGYDLLALIIETRKDQMAKMQWSVRPKDPKVKPDARCKEIEDFFVFPDREHDWDAWLRALLNDMLIVDAATVLPQFTRGGKPYKLELMDGTTLKRTIDESGRTPEPPDVAYQQILKGIVACDYSSDEIVFAPRNVRTNKLYGYSPVEQTIMTVNIAIRRQLHQLQYYSEGSTPDLVFSVPETWTPDQAKQFKDWWDTVLAGNTGSRRGTMFVPSGVTPFDTKEKALKDEYDEWLARIICFAFSISSQPFVKQMNRATAETAQKAALEEGLQPVMIWVRNLVNRLIWKYWGYTDLTFAWVDEKVLDPEVQAKVDDLKIRNGSLLINESRAKEGLDPIEGGDVPLFTGSPTTLDRVLNPPDPIATGFGDPVGGAPDEPKPKKEPAKEGEKKKPAEKLAKAKQHAPINRNRKAVKTAKADLRKIMVKLLDAQMPDIVQQLGKAMGIVAKVDDEEVDRILRELDFSGWAVVVGDIQDLIDEIAKDGAAQALVQIGINDVGITEQVNERALAFAKDRAAEMVGKKWVGGELVDNPNAEYAITDGTRELLRSTVYQAIDERWSIDELATAIEEGNGFSEDRADLIARTEVARADVEGNMTGYRESGVVEKKIWLLSNDDNVCDLCEGNAAQGEIDLDEDFESGDDAPPLHPGCQCDVAPVVYETAESEET